MTRTSNYKRAILDYQKTTDYRNGVSKEAFVNYPKATKKLANPKRKNKVCKDVVREIITEEDYQQLIEEKNELVSKCSRLQEQVEEANILIGIMCPHMDNETLKKCIEYGKKWGVE